jgi:serine/threonine protein kinase
VNRTNLGAYEMVERIGEGGMGEVWLARHRHLRRLVAVKVIRPESLSSGNADDARRLFEREAHATSTLRSPHTIAVFDYGATDEGNVYYAMELLEGLSLSALVSEFGAVPPERAAYLLAGICESLGESHERGLVHRDVKPANVFSCVLGGKYDFVKVLDFGLVKSIAGLDGNASPITTATIAGSPAFLAPEAVRGVIAPSCDIYAFGCVAYWLLTGKLVFEGKTPLEIILAHAQIEPMAPSARVGVAMPAALDELVLDCLKKDPAQRPPSIAAIAERLEVCPLETKWTNARARRFFDENRDVIARVNPAMRRVHELSSSSEGGSVPELRAAVQPDDAERQAKVKASLDQLQHHFTRSHIDLHELELRMLRVKKAKSRDEIDRVLSDLPSLQAPPPAPPVITSALPPPLDDRESARKLSKLEARSARAARRQARRATRGGPMIIDQDPNPHLPMRSLDDAELALATYVPQPLGAHVVSVMSSTRRAFVVQDGEISKAVAVMGEATLFIDGSQLDGGVAELRCVAVMGNITIYVQPGIDVEASGVGVLGMFEQWGGRAPGQNASKLRITGVAVLGFVKVITGNP